MKGERKRTCDCVYRGCIEAVVHLATSFLHVYCLLLFFLCYSFFFTVLKFFKKFFLCLWMGGGWGVTCSHSASVYLLEMS